MSDGDRLPSDAASICSMRSGIRSCTIGQEASSAASDAMQVAAS